MDLRTTVPLAEEHRGAFAPPGLPAPCAGSCLPQALPVDPAGLLLPQCDSHMFIHEFSNQPTAHMEAVSAQTPGNQRPRERLGQFNELHLLDEQRLRAAAVLSPRLGAGVGAGRSLLELPLLPAHGAVLLHLLRVEPLEDAVHVEAVRALAPHQRAVVAGHLACTGTGTGPPRAHTQPGAGTAAPPQVLPGGAAQGTRWQGQCRPACAWAT